MIVIVDQRLLEKRSQEVNIGLFYLKVDSDVIYIFIISILNLKDINSQFLYCKENVIYIQKEFSQGSIIIFFKLNIIKYMVSNIKNHVDEF